MTSNDLSRFRIHVNGTVQGVGFRPFVWALARKLNLSGFVGNDSAGVILEIEGTGASVREFRHELAAHPPALAVIETITELRLEPLGSTGFFINESERTGESTALVSADVSTCTDCLREITDPGNRRFRYAFTNCTACGPRFTIVRGIPYDRANTTMSGFPLCEPCRVEYENPADRRFHAQPVCCSHCGPRLQLLDKQLREVAGDPIETAAKLLHDGAVLAIKGLGGYHLATAALSETAVSRLRSRKHREERPFALMVPDLATAQTLCEVTGADTELLTSAARPIVVMRRREGTQVAPSVAPRSPTLGVMLPYTPLHHLLLAEVGEALVMTSGNLSDEPIAYLDDDARERLAGVADAFLTHDRPIETRVDDSVVRVMAGAAQPIRRSRGYVPTPLRLPIQASRHILACGSQLKNTFCLARDDRAFMSHHIGDLDNFETLTSFTTGIEHLSRLFEIRPAVVAHDLHPEYLSTKYALDLDGVELIGVQHHHAHIASCMADNGHDEAVIGVAFDGVGYGTDGTAWGGEFLVADLRGFERISHLEPMRMPGGDAAVKAPWRMALSFLDAAFDGSPPAGLAVMDRNLDQWAQVRAAVTAAINSPFTSSAGRLFDAVAALVGIRDEVAYEGQAAIELEYAADRTELDFYAMPIEGAEPSVVRTTALVRAVVADLADGASAAVISGRFHNSISAMIVEGCVQARDAHRLDTVALSGGVFQNALLLERSSAALQAQGFAVLTHRQVPANDGGISFGQAAVAAVSTW